MLPDFIQRRLFTETKTHSVEFKSLSKSFGEYKVLTDVSFSAKPGEVIALMGENGAGKSTLMRILAGVYPLGSYTGNILLNGQELKLKNVRDGKRSGIAMIHQEMGLFPELTVAENLLLEEVQREHPFSIRWNSLFKEAQDYLDSLNFKIDARALISSLNTGSCQLVEIARALRSNASILIMDEPTSALTEPEVVCLFELLNKLKSAGKLIFYVSHRMDEIAKIATRVVVLRDGIIAGVDETKNLDRDKIIRWMVGRDVHDLYPKRNPRPTTEAPLLKVNNLSLTHRSTGKKIVQNVSLQLYPGEVLGLAGLIGAGRSEFVLSLFGYFGEKGPHRNSHELSGEIYFQNKKTKWTTPAKALSQRVALLTEDRKGTGLLLNRPAAENITLSTMPKLGGGKRLGFINGHEEHKQIKLLSTHLKIRGPGLHTEVALYSGGNQQKVALAKCLAVDPILLILDEPTRGIDIGAKLEIYEIMNRLAQSGVGILLVSSELPELLGLSDRILVLKKGALAGEFTRSFDPEKIMNAASL